MAGLGLGANPIEELLHELGRWGLKFLLLTLAVTPLRRWTGWNWLIRFRRMLGLFAFFYVVLHFTVYAVLDQGLDISAIIEDILKRPYITLGMAGLLMLIPLAVTSTRGMMRRLGKRWQKLHRLVYVIAIAACLAFLLAGETGYTGCYCLRADPGRIARARVCFMPAENGGQ